MLSKAKQAELAIGGTEAKLTHFSKPRQAELANGGRRSDFCTIIPPLKGEEVRL